MKNRTCWAILSHDKNQLLNIGRTKKVAISKSFKFLHHDYVIKELEDQKRIVRIEWKVITPKNKRISETQKHKAKNKTDYTNIGVA